MLLNYKINKLMKKSLKSKHRHKNIKIQKKQLMKKIKFWKKIKFKF